MEKNRRGLVIIRFMRAVSLFAGAKGMVGQVPPAMGQVPIAAPVRAVAAREATRKFSVLSLFSGCGGLDLGFTGGFRFFGKNYARLPFNVIWANDIDPTACETYRANLGNEIVCEDIRHAISGIPRADVVIGGFPCQDVSVNGKGLGSAGERTTLYGSMIQAVRKARPRLFMAENVRGLMAQRHDHLRKEIIDGFSILGYHVSVGLYLAADYGVPQMRERIFIVGTKKGEKRFTPPLPLLAPGRWITAKRAIEDLESMGESDRINHIWSKAKAVGEQGNRVLKPDFPATTMRAECHGHIQFHYALPRRISMREAARFQAFPDKFTFKGGIRQIERQIGNAVPPVLGWHMAKAASRRPCVMTTDEFELFLDEVCRTLGDEVRESNEHHEAAPFQRRVLQVMQNVAHERRLQITPTNHPHAFPDIKANGFGVEVKSTRQDSWDATANSILETMRDKDAKRVYVVFGKMGGMPGVLWRRYEEAINHVRISHAPRFVVGMKTEVGKSLFDTIGLSYEHFAKKTPEEKMSEVRKYARARLRPGEKPVVVGSGNIRWN